MIGERGPDGRLHVPEHRSGCYRARIERCCWLCLGRILGARLRDFPVGRSGSTSRAHPLVGTEIVVPALHRAMDRGAVEYLVGRITAIDESNGSAVFGVRLEDDEEILLTIRRP